MVKICFKRHGMWWKTLLWHLDGVVEIRKFLANMRSYHMRLGNFDVANEVETCIQEITEKRITLYGDKILASDSKGMHEKMLTVEDEFDKVDISIFFAARWQNDFFVKYLYNKMVTFLECRELEKARAFEETIWHIKSMRLEYNEPKNSII